VSIKKLSQNEIQNYIATGEPLDKAWAFAIQWLWSIIVERIEGDYFNVVGLPLNELSKTLKNFNIHIL
jgi:septum formation protein